MKAILVEAATGKVSEVQVNHFTDINKHLGCDTFEMPWMDHGTGDCMYCDEEANIKGEPPQFFVQTYWFPQPIAGNVLFLGGDMSTGESKDVTLTLGEVMARVICHDRNGRKVIPSSNN